jgi:hypothetical protein
MCMQFMEFNNSFTYMLQSVTAEDNACHKSKCFTAKEKCKLTIVYIMNKIIHKLWSRVWKLNSTNSN